MECEEGMECGREDGEGTTKRQEHATHPALLSLQRSGSPASPSSSVLCLSSFVLALPDCLTPAAAPPATHHFHSLIKDHQIQTDKALERLTSTWATEPLHFQFPPTKNLRPAEAMPLCVVRGWWWWGARG
jgi:hypothetical protein